MSSRFRRASVHKEDGFTIIEQMVTAVIMMIVVAGLIGAFTALQKTTVRQSARGQALDEMRVVMQRMTKEIRQATSVRATSGATTLDMDTYVNGTARRVTYVAGTNLTRAVDGGSAVVVLQRLTTTSLFTYAPSTTDASDVTVVITMRPEHFSVDNASISLSSEIKLRNRSSA